MIPDPRNLVTSRIAIIGEAVAHVVIGEGSPAHGVPAGAYGRWHDGSGDWSAWHLIEAGARDVDVIAAPGRPGPAALVAVVAWTPPAVAPTGQSVTWTTRFFWLTADGIEPADL